jgi:hypothetical protein
MEIPVKRGNEMKSPVRIMNKAYAEKVVIVEATIGEGSAEDPVRNAKLYFTEDGVFIGEVL